MLFHKNSNNKQKKLTKVCQNAKKQAMKITEAKLPVARYLPWIKGKLQPLKYLCFGSSSRITIKPFETEQLDVNMRKFSDLERYVGSQHFLYSFFVLFCLCFWYLKWYQCLFPSVGYVSNICSATCWLWGTSGGSRQICGSRCLLCGHYE